MDDVADREVLGGRLVAAAQPRAHPGDELLGLERLGDVVVGTRLKTEHEVDGVALGREHDDRHAGLGADLPADLVAVLAGQHQVEQHEVRLRRAEHTRAPRHRPRRTPGRNPRSAARCRSSRPARCRRRPPARVPSCAHSRITARRARPVRVRHAACCPQITRSRLPRTWRHGTMIPPRGPGLAPARTPAEPREQCSHDEPARRRAAGAEPAGLPRPARRRRDRRRRRPRTAAPAARIRAARRRSGTRSSHRRTGSSRRPRRLGRGPPPRPGGGSRWRRRPVPRGARPRCSRGSSRCDHRARRDLRRRVPRDPRQPKVMFGMSAIVVTIAVALAVARLLVRRGPVSRSSTTSPTTSTRTASPG